jgi:hypothetical protein
MVYSRKSFNATVFDDKNNLQLHGEGLMSLSKGQEVSGHAVMVEMQVYGGQSGIGTGFFSSQILQFCPVSIIPLMLYSHSSSTTYQQLTAMVNNT